MGVIETVLYVLADMSLIFISVLAFRYVVGNMEKHIAESAKNAK